MLELLSWPLIISTATTALYLALFYDSKDAVIAFVRHSFSKTIRCHFITLLAIWASVYALFEPIAWWWKVVLVLLFCAAMIGTWISMVRLWDRCHNGKW